MLGLGREQYKTLICSCYTAVPMGYGVHTQWAVTLNSVDPARWADHSQPDAVARALRSTWPNAHSQPRTVGHALEQYTANGFGTIWGCIWDLSVLGMSGAACRATPYLVFPESRVCNAAVEAQFRAHFCGLRCSWFIMFDVGSSVASVQPLRLIWQWCRGLLHSWFCGQLLNRATF